MRGVLAVLVFATVFLGNSLAVAGSFEAGLVNESDFDRWVCGDIKPSASSSGYSCRTAGFDQCVACDSIVLTNTSAATISPKIEISGDEFNDHFGGAFGGMAGCPEREEPAAMMPCATVAPGRKCFQEFQFCPSHSGENTGQIKITVQGVHGPETQTIPIRAKAVYSSAIQSAEKVLDSHRTELMKFPHVKRVSLDKEGETISIKVEVKDDSDDDEDRTDEYIEQVQRMIPPQIEGYPVEVTNYEDVGYAF